MAPSSLLEAAAALGLEALALSSLLCAATNLAVLTRDAWELHAETFRERHLEHLIETAGAYAGSGPGRPAAVAAASALSIVFHADVDGDGAVDSTSAERTELELRAGAGGTRNLFHHVGRQSMKVADGLSADAHFELSGANGAAADPSHATALLVPFAGVSRTVVLPLGLP
jgi:hypothetical protein